MRHEFGGGQWLVDPVLAVRRGAIVALGYGLAVLVATLATVLHLGVPSVLPDDGAWGSLNAFLRDGPMLLAGGVSMVAPFGLPGFLIAVFLVAVTGRRGRVVLTIAGGLNAFVALGLSGWFNSGPGGGDLYFVFSCFGGGLAGGYAYWLFAEAWAPPVRFLSRRVSAPAPSGS